MTIQARPDLLEIPGSMYYGEFAASMVVDGSGSNEVLSK